MASESLREPHAQTIGPYEVLLDIGAGGMGTISLGRATGEPVGVGGFTRLVALKRPHSSLASEPEVLHRFLDEARLLAQVHHANVVGIHQIGSDAGGHFLVLDYVEGGTLDELMTRAVLRRKKLAPPLALRIVSDVLSGLHAVHEAVDANGQPLRMLHRDVSAQNVLVGKDGVARLADFGIAKAITSVAVTDKAYLQGRVPYMAPEYLRREPVDRQLDVYAIGVTLWAAIAGDLPWPDASEAQIVHEVVHGGIPPLSIAGVTVAPALQALVARACARDVRERFATARAMLDAIEDLGRHTGWIASHAEVATLVDELLGRELSLRRAAIARRLSVLASPSSARAEERRAGVAQAKESASGTGVSGAVVSGGVASGGVASGVTAVSASGVMAVAASGAVAAWGTGAAAARAGVVGAASRGRRGVAVAALVVTALGTAAVVWRWGAGLAGGATSAASEAQAASESASGSPALAPSASESASGSPALAPSASESASGSPALAPSASALADTPSSPEPSSSALALPPSAGPGALPASPPRTAAPARPGATPTALPTAITTTNPYR